MIAALTNVVIVVIAADGTISVIGGFISEQRAHQHITEHPELHVDNGTQTIVYRMDKPQKETY